MTELMMLLRTLTVIRLCCDRDNDVKNNTVRKICYDTENDIKNINFINIIQLY